MASAVAFVVGVLPLLAPTTSPWLTTTATHPARPALPRPPLCRRLGRRCSWAGASPMSGPPTAPMTSTGGRLTMRSGGDGADGTSPQRPTGDTEWDGPDAAGSDSSGGRPDGDSGAFVVRMDSLRQWLSSATAAGRGGSESSRKSSSIGSGSGSTVAGSSGGLSGLGVSAQQEESFRAAKVLNVILFPAGGHPGDASSGDGLYTVQMGGVNVVLAFAAGDDAKRYALMLQAIDFPAPGVPMNVTAVERTELQSFCDEDGHRLGFVPTDAVVTPPDGAAVEAKAWLESSRSSRSSSSSSSSSSTTSSSSPLPSLSQEEREVRDRLNRLFDQQ